MTSTSADSRQIRLLLFCNSVQMGGMEEHVRLIAQELDREAFWVAAVVPSWPPTEQLAERLETVTAECHRLTPDRRHGWLAALRESVRLFRLARQRRFDVAHLHSTTFDGLGLAALALRAGGVRRILVTEHLAPDRPPPARIRLKRRVLGRLVSGFISVSEKNRELRQRYMRTRSDRLHVVVNGIDAHALQTRAAAADPDAARAALGLEPDDVVVGTAIRFEPGKGIVDLIEAFARLDGKGRALKLLLAGDGSLRGELERKVEVLGLTDDVLLPGFLDEPLEAMTSMDVFVLPVPFGSASIALLEAMALGRSCVITFGGEGEAVVHGETGLWAEPSDPASLATELQRLVDDPKLRERLGNAARRHIDCHFSAARVAADLEALYRST